MSNDNNLHYLFISEFFKLTNLKHLVLDEADTLLDDSFIDGTKWLLRRIPVRNFVLVKLFYFFCFF